MSDTAGRDTELGLLRQALKATIEGHGVSILLTGAPGIGKSWLVDRLVQTALDCGIDVVTATASPPNALRPFGFVIDLLNHYEAGTGEWRDELVEAASLVPSIAKELFPNQPPPIPTSDDPGQDRALYLARISRLITKAQTDQGLLVCLDDAHLADSGSVQFLSLLAARNDQARIMIVAAYDTDETGDTANSSISTQEELKRHGHVRAVRLNPLDVAATRTVVDSRFPRNSFSLGMIRFIHHRTGGIPLAVVQFMDSLSEKGQIKEIGGSWVADDLTGLISGGLVSAREVIRERLERLSGSNRKVLGHASAQGEVFLARVVAKTLGRTNRRVTDALTSLLSKTGAFRAIRPGVFRFIHPVVTDVCLKMLPAAERKNVHLRLAEFYSETSLSPSLVAHHFYSAEDYQRAIDPFIITARLAFEAGLYVEATAAIERAESSVIKVGTIRVPTQHLDVMCLKSNIAAECEDYLAGKEAASLVLSHSSVTPEQRAKALLNLGIAYRGNARFEAALDALTQARLLYEELGDSRFVAEAELLCTQEVLRGRKDRG